MTPYYTDESVTLLLGDALEMLRTLPDGSADCCVTSPPYLRQRDYDVEGQYGSEGTIAEYVSRLVAVFDEVRRVLAEDGTLWLNIGDSYAAASPSGPQGRSGQRATRTFTASGRGGLRDLPPKNLLGVPWRAALALQQDGWVLRNAIVWNKPNAKPESVRDRLSNRYEFVFLLAPRPAYRFDLDAIRVPHSPATVARARRAANPYLAPGQTENLRSKHVPERGANPGDVWSIPTRGFRGAHYATFPTELPSRCIAAADVRDGYVLDPFSGTGTTGLAARAQGHRYVGVDLDARSHDMAITRFQQGVLTGGAA